ncbi:hypothetical protein [Ramlibacter albus]|uniref:Uncharacterized protein n=1 Tax=Ramlibacter albus TaxID=2079448 RepID=A0A923M794_9BURK|nr:hypothetical protein [Ramlibacter albus]MBC5764665.1 hypothetical protein [Ramlibacter albus]
MLSVESRIQAVVDDHMFKTFWEAAAHFKTDDLVVFFNEGHPSESLTVSPRISVCDSKDLPDKYKAKLQRPSREAAVRLKDSDASFWLVANFTDGQGACAAINAKPLTPGGTA